MRVMIVIDARRVSGPAKGVLDFCESARGRVDPVVVAFQRGAEGTEFQHECRRRSIRVEVVRERYRYDVSLVSRTLRLARVLRPHLVQTHGYKADLLGFAIRRSLGIPWVAFNHGPTDEGTRMRLYLALDSVLLRRADQVVAVSEARRTAMVRTGCPPARLVTIHNAVEIPQMGQVGVSQVRHELGLPSDGPVLAVVGRLSPEKGQGYFVDAMAEVSRAVPGVRGLIVGEGPEEGRLRGRVAALGMQNVIHFLGYRRDMDRIYPGIDVLVLPSLSEGLPNVVLEAMAHGRPVIGTRVGGVPEVVDDGVTGLVVAPQDASALARAMLTLLRDPARCAAMGRAARERINRNFSPGARAERILTLYEDMLQHHTDRGTLAEIRLTDRSAEVR